MSPGELRDRARDLGRHSLETEMGVYACGGGAEQKRVGMVGRDGLTGLRAYARAVDGDGVATFAQATQERLGECGVSEEVLPGRIG
jgi:hypothetical protein